MNQCQISLLCKEALERFPFGVVFSKIAPVVKSFDEIDIEKDFCYYYFSTGLEKRSALKRSNMCAGDINAKRDFPNDYIQYFKDDFKVVSEFGNGRVMAFCEPWSPPGVIGDVHFIYTLKTAINVESISFMLGTFELINSTVLDNNTYSDIAVEYNCNSELSAMNSAVIPESWFQIAFDSLPIGLAIFDVTNGIILYSNDKYISMTKPTGPNLSAYVIKHLSNTDSVSTAIWLSNLNIASGYSNVDNLSPESITYNTGIYDILDKTDGFNKIYKVIVLRPIMSIAAKPRYSDGKLIDIE